MEDHGFVTDGDFTKMPGGRASNSRCLRHSNGWGVFPGGSMPLSSEDFFQGHHVTLDVPGHPRKRIRRLYTLGGAYDLDREEPAYL